MTEQESINNIRKYLNLPETSKKDDTGRQLARSIAQYLGDQWMTWVEMPLGSVQYGNAHRVDVFAMSKSYKFVTRIYEVKISRSDFQKDLFEGKYKAYLPFCNYLYFATPSGLIQKNEVPKGCGLITFGEKGWSGVKGPVHHDVKIDPELMMALLMRGYQDNYEKYRDLENRRYEKNWEYKGFADAANEFGLKLSYDVTHAQEYVERVNELKENIEKIANQKFNDMGSAYQWLYREVDNLLNKHKHGKEAAQVLEIAMNLYDGLTWGTARELREIADRLEPKT
jgi:hypothetical protein